MPARRFAGDIKEMKNRHEIDKILLLCFPFIAEFEFNSVKNVYNMLLKTFTLKDDYAFERARTTLQDKVEFGNCIKFSHPSYSKALLFLLLDDGIPTEINTEYFSKVLINLADNAASIVASAVAYNFDKLPGDKLRSMVPNIYW